MVYANLDNEGRFIKSNSIYQPVENGDSELVSRVHYISVNKAEDTLMVNNVGLDIIPLANTAGIAEL